MSPPTARELASELGHLARRFVFSLRPGAPDPADEAWLLDLLSAPEQALYRAQPPADRVHSLRCARAVHRSLGDDAPSEVIIASALHDVGKAGPALGTGSRVLSAVFVALLGSDRVHGWSAGTGYRARLGTHAAHAGRGAELLAAAQSSELTIAWARGHHDDAAGDVDRRYVVLLQQADRT